MSLDPYQLARSQQQGPKRGHISTETRSRIPTGLRQRDELLRMQENVLLFSSFWRFQSCTQNRGGWGGNVRHSTCDKQAEFDLCCIRGNAIISIALPKPRWCRLRIVSENSLWFDVNVSGGDTQCEHGPKRFVSIQFDLNIWFFQFDGNQFDLIAWRPNLQITFLHSSLYSYRNRIKIERIPRHRIGSRNLSFWYFPGSGIWGNFIPPLNRRTDTSPA